MESFRDSQRTGVATLLGLSEEVRHAGDARQPRSGRHDGPYRSRRCHCHHRGSHLADVVAPVEGHRGALADSYQIPDVSFRQRWPLAIILLAFGASIAGLSRHIAFIGYFTSYRPLMIIWTLAFGFSAVQWLLSLGDQPWRLSRTEKLALRALTVVVNVPVFNEEPATLDRCLYSLARQTRPPDRVEIVDDGSDVDYTELRDHWHAWHGPTEFRWIRRNVNKGKKHVQAVTFAGRADIFVTVDSDTALESRAIAEGIQPFTDPPGMSVAA